MQMLISLSNLARIPAYTAAFFRGDLLVRQDVPGFKVATLPEPVEAVRNLLQPWCATVILLDSIYRLCGVKDARRIVEWDKTNLQGFSKNTSDCDDYVRGLFRSAPLYFGVTGFGIALDWDRKPPHAFSIVVCAGGVVMYLEPQSDTWRVPTRIGWGMILI